MMVTQSTVKGAFILVILFSSLFAMIACDQATNGTPTGNSITASPPDEERVVKTTKFGFYTEDGFFVQGMWHEPLEQKHKQIVLLLHGFEGSGKDFDLFTESLLVQGFSVITMDFRGHGESTKRNQVVFAPKDLTLHDFNSLASDLDGVVTYLSVKKEDLFFFVIGADMGANVAVHFAKEHEDLVDKLVLLSPSLNSFGITTREVMPALNLPVFFISSVDEENDLQSAQTLYDLMPETKKELKLYYDAGHGTQMLLLQNDLPALISSWLLK